MGYPQIKDGAGLEILGKKEAKMSKMKRKFRHMKEVNWRRRFCVQTVEVGVC